jgi:hypothetical protein
MAVISLQNRYNLFISHMNNVQMLGYYAAALMHFTPRWHRSRGNRKDKKKCGRNYYRATLEQ